VPDKPLIVWSHGDFVTSVVLLFLGFDLEPEGADLGLAPSLPPGMNHARIDRFRFRDWHLGIELARRDGRVEARVASTDAPDASRTLAICLPAGVVVRLVAGGETRFTVDPRDYYAQFGRCRNGAERALITSRVLAGREPERDPAGMTPSEQERLMVDLETSYVPANP